MPINQFTQQANFLLAALAGAERVFEAHGLAAGDGRGHRWSWSHVREEDGR